MFLRLALFCLLTIIGGQGFAMMRPVPQALGSTCFDENSTPVVVAYYGYRYYDAVAGRWGNRDPIWEHIHEVNSTGLDGKKSRVTIDVVEFGSNDYHFNFNNSINRFDLDGDQSITSPGAAALAADLAAVAEGYGSAADMAQVLAARAAAAAAKAAAEAAAKVAAETAAKVAARELAKKIATCTAIWTTYKAAEDKARACSPQMDPAVSATNCALWSASVAGRTAWLGQKCDYSMPGSIARGSQVSENGHRKELGTKSAAMINCCACAVAGGK